MIAISNTNRGRRWAAPVLMILVTLSAVIALPSLTASAQEAATCLGFAVTVDIGAGDLATDGDDVIAGTAGDDVIAGGAGDDRICGGGGNDSIWGQAGIDHIDGGAGDDKLRGGDGDDVLLGGSGDDNINGGRDNDNIYAGDGADTARGGTGHDTIDGGLGDNKLLAGNGGSDVIHGQSGNDALISGGPRPDSLNGGGGDDLIRGLGGADQINGGAGNDHIFGGPQPDTIDGGPGADACNGGTEPDVGANCESLVALETHRPLPPEVSGPGVASVDFDQMYHGIGINDGLIYTAYKTIIDVTGQISLKVPEAFVYVDGEGNVNRPQLIASSDSNYSLGEPTIAVHLLEAQDLDLVLAQNGPAFVADCTVLTTGYELPTSIDYEGLLFAEPLTVDRGPAGPLTGAYIIYESCGFGQERTSVVEIALATSDGRIALVRISVRSNAELAVIDEMLASLAINDPAGG